MKSQFKRNELPGLLLQGWGVVHLWFVICTVADPTSPSTTQPL